MNSFNHLHARDYDRAFLVGVALNSGYIIVEVALGMAAHSMALLADAGHNLSDVLGLLLAWGAFRLMRQAPSERRTYGWRKISILTALFNSLLLLLVIGGVGWEAIRRLSHPVAISGPIIIWTAAAGILINSASAILFRPGKNSDLNIRGAFLHLISDAGISAGVLFSGIVISSTGWVWLDPVVSLLIMAVIMWGTWGLLRDSFNLAIDSVPRHINLEEIKRFLLQLPGVQTVHDLHIWAMSTSDVALTAHLVVQNPNTDQASTLRIHKSLSDRFGIHHTTIQLEPAGSPSDCESCCGTRSHPT